MESICSRSFGNRNISPSLEKYSWTIPVNVLPGTKYKILITGVIGGATQPYQGTVGLSDDSDNYFSIVAP